MTSPSNQYILLKLVFEKLLLDTPSKYVNERATLQKYLQKIQSHILASEQKIFSSSSTSQPSRIFHSPPLRQPSSEEDSVKKIPSPAVDGTSVSPVESSSLSTHEEQRTEKEKDEEKKEKNESEQMEVDEQIGSSSTWSSSSRGVIPSSEAEKNEKIITNQLELSGTSINMEQIENGFAHIASTTEETNSSSLSDKIEKEKVIHSHKESLNLKSPNEGPSLPSASMSPPSSLTQIHDVDNSATIMTSNEYWSLLKPFFDYSLPVKMQETALDGLQKLISNDILILNEISSRELIPSPEISIDLQTSPHLSAVRLSDEIVAAVVDSFDKTLSLGHTPPDSIQLQILKLFLSMMTLPHCDLHGISVRRIFRICHKVYTHTKNEAVKMTSKASVLQMINFLLSKHEITYQQLTHCRQEIKDYFEKNKVIQGDHSPIINIKNGTLENIDGHDVHESDEESSVEENSVEDKYINDVADPSYVKRSHGYEDQHHQSVLNFYDGLSESSTSIEPGYFGYCCHCHTLANYWCLTEKIPICKNVCDHPIKMDSMKSTSSVSPSVLPDSETGQKHSVLSYNDLEKMEETDHLLSLQYRKFGLESYLNILKDDCIIVVELLLEIIRTCDKKSSSNTPLSPGSKDHSRIFCYELLLCILSYSGEELRSNDIFIDLLRNQLCLSLCNSGIHSDLFVFELNLSIFLTLLQFYRSPLKAQIEVLFNEVYFSLLDPSGSSSPQHLFLFLQALYKICQSPQLLVDIYVNYDCDIGLQCIYERIVYAIASFLQYGDFLKRLKEHQFFHKLYAVLESNGSTEAISLSGSSLTNLSLKSIDIKFKILAIKCTLAILNSFYEWYSEGLKVNDGDGHQHQNQKKKEEFSTVECRSSSPPQPIFFQKHPLSSLQMVQRSIKSQSTEFTPPEDTSQTEENKTLKSLLRQGIHIFNTSKNPFDGLEFLAQHKFIDSDSIFNCAQFLRSNMSIDKKALGDFLGQPDPRSVAIMHSFIDGFNFRDLDFVDALRTLLSSFRLPGESQKIDRIMEKFADRYCECNPSIFSTADTAYTLAYSIIMLNTDLHSVKIRNKMTKESFIKNNRNIHSESSSPEVTDDLLEKIYDNIAEKEIILDESWSYFKKAAPYFLGDSVRKSSIGESVDVNRVDGITQSLNVNLSSRNKISDAARIKIKTESLLQEARPISSFKRATNVEHINPMLDILIKPIFGSVCECYSTFSCRESKDQDLFRLVFFLIFQTIQVSSKVDMPYIRHVFLELLSYFCILEKPEYLDLKNLWSMKCLLIIGVKCGNDLTVDDWIQVVRLTSKLDELDLLEGPIDLQVTDIISKGGVTDILKKETIRADDFESLFPSDHKIALTYEKSLFVDYFSSKRKALSLAQLQEIFQEQDIPKLVENIYSKSTSLDVNSIVALFGALCRISSEDLGLLSHMTDGRGLGLSPLSPSSQQEEIAHANVSTVQSNISSSPLPSVVRVTRIYCLQKIVEVAYYNLGGRIRLEWSQIWRLLGPHFNSAGLHPNLQVCKLAIDSLRQLCMKFLERDELGHYKSQNDLFKSFETIMRQTNSLEVKDLLLDSLKQMIVSKASNIRSGWKPIITIADLGIDEVKKEIEVEGKNEIVARIDRNIVDLLHRVQSDCFHCLMNAGNNIFGMYLNCIADYIVTFSKFEGSRESKTAPVLKEYIWIYKKLKKFSLSDLTNRVTESDSSQNVNENIDLTSSYHQNIVPSKELLAGDGNNNSILRNIAEQSNSNHDQCAKWYLILSSISQIIVNSKSHSTRSSAVDLLFQILLDDDVLRILNSDMKSWFLIYRSVFFPIFEELLVFDELPERFSEVIKQNFSNGEMDTDQMETTTASTLPSLPPLKDLNKQKTPSPNLTRKTLPPEIEMIPLWINILTRWVDLIAYHPNPLFFISEKNAASSPIFLSADCRKDESEQTKSFLAAFMELLKCCIVRFDYNIGYNNSLAHSSILCIEQLIMKTYDRLSSMEWRSFGNFILSILSWTLPENIFSKEIENGASQMDFDLLTYKAEIHLSVIDGLLKDIHHLALENNGGEKDSTTHFSQIYFSSPLIINLFSEALRKSHQFAHQFNHNLDLRRRLYKIGNLPSIEGFALRKQEINSLTQNLTLLFDCCKYNINEKLMLNWAETDILQVLILPLKNRANYILDLLSDQLSLATTTTANDKKREGKEDVSPKMNCPQLNIHNKNTDVDSSYFELGENLNTWISLSTTLVRCFYDLDFIYLRFEETQDYDTSVLLMFHQLQTFLKPLSQRLFDLIMTKISWVDLPFTKTERQSERWILLQDKWNSFMVHSVRLIKKVQDNFIVI